MTEAGAKSIQDLALGEKVLTSGGTYERVVDKEDDVKHDVNAIVKTAKDSFSCSPNHRWLVKRDCQVHEVMTTDLRKGDKLLFIKQKSP
jgi:preprotein translocase subunit YajC